jgi:L-threonylcarbamoyladenylate synthase
MKIDLQQAIFLLKHGHVVGLPTETVYGLAACLNQPLAIEKIFELKNRPLANPLIIHVADQREVDAYVTDFPPGFAELAKAFWPGPLTLILPIKPPMIHSIVRADLPTAGFRFPDQILTRKIISQVGPLVMPSANLSGRPSSTTPEHVEQDFGCGFPVLDGGKCKRGLESTILCYKDAWVIARMGALSAEDLQKVLGYKPENMVLKKDAQPLCPGQLFRHYAPKARLFLGVDEIDEATHILGFEGRTYLKDKFVYILGSTDEPLQVAGNVYQKLRQLDEDGVQAAWIDMNFPQEGLWKTITERLRRAAGSS